MRVGNSCLSYHFAPFYAVVGGKWLGRFSRERMAGLADQHRSGTRQRKYSWQTEERILQALDSAARKDTAAGTDGS